MTYYESPFINSTCKNGILELQLNRPQKRNALNHEMYTILASAICNATVDNDIRVLILSGAENNFTAGNDLEDFSGAAGALQDREKSPVFSFMQALKECSKPVISAVEGLAVGIGATLLLHCDLIYAGKDSTFRFPFTRLGLCPEYASSLLLPKLVGHAKAFEWLVLGEPFSAEQALSAGLINEIADNPRQKALSVAESIAGLPAMAVINTKALMKKHERSAIMQAINKEADVFVQALQGEEFAKAVTAFFEKRASAFSERK